MQLSHEPSAPPAPSGPAPGHDLPSEALARRLLAPGHEHVVSLGASAFGVRQLAHDSARGRSVCIEWWPRRVLGSWRTLRAQLDQLATLGDPDVAPLIDAGLAGGAWPYVITEVRRAFTLRDALVSAGRFDLARVLRLGARCAGALAGAHGEGIVHGLLAPDRVFLGPPGPNERVQLQGFGAAAVFATAPDALLSSPPEVFHYASPEHVQGVPLDARSDIYSLGAILHELASGRPLHRGGALAVLRGHLRATPEPLPRPVGPPDLAHHAFARILDRCLHKAPDSRYQSAAQLASDLTRLAAALARAAAHPAPPPTGASVERASAVAVSPPRHPPRKSQVGLRRLPKVIVRAG